MLNLRQACRVQYGLTLTELLVILAVLGAMATAIVPSASYLLTRSQHQNIEQSLKNSWQFAQAVARANQRPVVWQLASGEKFTQLTILDADGNKLRKMALPTTNLRARISDSDEEKSNLTYIVYPHGLTDPLTLHWEINGKPLTTQLGQIESGSEK